MNLKLLVLILVCALGGSGLQAQSNQMKSISYGEILSVEPIMIENRPSGRGARTGGTVGAIAGAALASRGDGLLGALIGGAIGVGVGAAIANSNQPNNVCSGSNCGY